MVITPLTIALPVEDIARTPPFECGFINNDLGEVKPISTHSTCMQFEGHPATSFDVKGTCLCSFYR
jgi:hypothetical protein